VAYTAKAYIEPCVTLVSGEGDPSVRVFIAIPLPADLKAKLVALQQRFRALHLEASWVRETGFHLTLKFLGEVDSHLIGPIISCTATVTRGYHPFSLTVSGVGVFPNDSSPRVLWVGVQDMTGLLRQVQESIEAHLTELGYPLDDRPFAPHLTLARLKRVPHRGEFLGVLKGSREEVVGKLEVDRIELVESQLLPSGAHYACVNAAYFPPTTHC
jgi:RNA 2',3'-cyclic 3'-phosphodiesterase